MPQRLRQLEDWLVRYCGLSGFSIAPASADASFRRYFRITLADGASRVAMDAPPDREDCQPFLRLAGLLDAAGLHVPQIFFADLEQGFLLVEDLGSTPYLDVLDEVSADALYADALEALLLMQCSVDSAVLPRYDRELLAREMALFPDWLLGEHLRQAPAGRDARMLADVFETLIAHALEQPTLCVHRDYHSRNLMWLESGNPGVIDFQDAVAGPASYDLVSLLRDCYISWPQSRVEAWVRGYHCAAQARGLLPGVDVERFLFWFDLMGVQRHLKAAGIFARLHHRDGKASYLRDIPRTLGYIVEVGRRRAEVSELADFVSARVLPCLPGYAAAVPSDAGDPRQAGD